MCQINENSVLIHLDTIEKYEKKKLKLERADRIE